MAYLFLDTTMSETSVAGSAVEAGGFVGYRFGGNQHGQGKVAIDLAVLKDVNDGHEGVIATPQISYAACRSCKVFVNIDAQANPVDDKYMRVYFGVPPVEAARSGLVAYRPDGSLRDIGGGITLGCQFNSK